MLHCLAKLYFRGIQENNRDPCEAKAQRSVRWSQELKSEHERILSQSTLPSGSLTRNEERLGLLSPMRFFTFDHARSAMDTLADN